MKAISTVFRRELAGYLGSPIGYLIIGFLLFIDGIMFQALVLGAGKKQLSGDVLQRFFEFPSGFGDQSNVVCKQEVPHPVGSSLAFGYSLFP